MTNFLEFCSFLLQEKHGSATGEMTNTEEVLQSKEQFSSVDEYALKVCMLINCLISLILWFSMHTSTLATLVDFGVLCRIGTGEKAIYHY